MKEDLWEALKKLTTARIALGRAGGSMPTQALLNFRLAHAKAKDAVLMPFDGDKIASSLELLGYETLHANSDVKNRDEYLQRPDRGRTLCPESKNRLRILEKTYDISLIVSDGLSAHAIHQNGIGFFDALRPLLKEKQWSFSPVVIVRNGRVAIEDEIGEIFSSRLALMLLGERPGLGSADSLGAYLVYAPKVGNTDANRNCISNIRRDGLSPAAAASRTAFLIEQSLKLQLSGVLLKDTGIQMPNQGHSVPARVENFTE